MLIRGRAAFAGRFPKGEKLRVEALLACVGVHVHPWIGPETRWVVVGQGPGAGKLAIAREHGVPVVDGAACLAAARGDVFGAVRATVAQPVPVVPAVYELLLALGRPEARGLAARYVLEHAGGEGSAAAWDCVRACLGPSEPSWSPSDDPQLPHGEMGTLMALRLAALRNELWRRPSTYRLRQVPQPWRDPVVRQLRQDLLGFGPAELGSWWIETKVDGAGPETGWGELAGRLTVAWDGSDDDPPPAVAAGLASSGVLALTGLPLVRLSALVDEVVVAAQRMRSRHPELHTLSVPVVRSDEAWEGLVALVRALPPAWTGLHVETGATVGFDQCHALGAALQGRQLRRLELGFTAETVGLLPILEAVHGQPLTHLEVGGTEWYLPSGLRGAAWWDTIETLRFRNPGPESGGLLTELFYGVKAPRLRHLEVDMAVHAGDLSMFAEPQIPRLQSLWLPGYDVEHDVARRGTSWPEVAATSWFARLRKLQLGACTDQEIDAICGAGQRLDWLDFKRGDKARASASETLTPLARWALHRRRTPGRDVPGGS
jgi:hypothetical protein